MSTHVSIILQNGERLDFELSDADLAGMDARAAQDWLGDEFEKAGLEPSNPMGKLLMADRVILLARAQSAASFHKPTPWIRDFLRATAVALRRPVVTIDLPGHSLGY